MSEQLFRNKKDSRKYLGYGPIKETKSRKMLMFVDPSVPQRGPH
jgi:hypothetical protein